MATQQMTQSEFIEFFGRALDSLTEIATNLSTLETLVGKAIAKEGYAAFKTSNYIVTDAVRDIKRTQQALSNFAIDDNATLKRIFSAASQN